MNCPELVDDILAALKAKPDENVKFGDNIMSLREALTHHFDVNKPSQELLAAVAKAAPQSELAALLAPEKRDDLKKWLWGRHVIDLLELLPAPLPVAVELDPPAPPPPPTLCAKMPVELVPSVVMSPV